MVTGSMTQALMPAAAQVAAGAQTSLFAKGLGGAAGGAIAAPVFVVGMMALDDRDYEAYEYIAKGGRASFVGAASRAAGSLVGAAAAGALGGAWGGPVGIVVGVIVGIGAYYLIDTAFGQAIEDRIERIFNPSVVDPYSGWDLLLWGPLLMPGVGGLGVLGSTAFHD